MMEEAPSRLLWQHPYLEAFMRYFNPPPDTRFFAGVDLHARSLFLSVLDHDRQERFARDLPAAPDPFLGDARPCGPGRRSPHDRWVRLVWGPWSQEPYPRLRASRGAEAVPSP